MENKRLRRYVFTLNNYTEEQWEAVKANLPLEAEYAVVGREKGEEKEVDHLQGYVELRKQTLFRHIKTWWELNILGAKPHFEVAKAGAEKNRLYCTKQGDYWEHGNIKKQGARMDIVAFKEAVKKGKSDIQLLEEHTTEFFKYGKLRNEIRQIYANEDANNQLRATMANAVLRPWQTQIIATLAAQTNRQVLWVWEKEGGVGKTWLADYLCAKGPVFLVDGGKKIDCAHAYNREPLVIFDFPREKEEIVQYNVLESFKNGVIFSGKYNSHVKRFKPCKVLCFANFPPKFEKLSKDRWVVFNFENGARQEREVPTEENNTSEKPVTTNKTTCSHNNCNETNCFCECHFN